MREYHASEILRLDAELLECPVRVSETEIAFVDVPRGRVHRARAGCVTETIDVGQPVGAVMLGAEGELWVAVRDGVARLVDGRPELVVPIEFDDADNLMNDAQVDPRGRIWAGTVAVDERPGAGALYRVDLDLSVNVARSATTISNGMGWNGAGTQMYYIDTPTCMITGYDFEPATGTIRNPTPVVTIADGLPDGMAVDADDNIWVAIWGAGEVRCYSTRGVLIGIVHIPTPFTTSCAFGGPDLRTLFVTSALEGPDVDGCGVFSCRVDRPGRPPHRVRVGTGF